MTHDVPPALRLPSWEAGPLLLGAILTYDDGMTRLSGRVVETEAYDQSDAASHSYKGRTPRVDVMFGPAGNFYVYFTYGMHYCCNVVTGDEGHGSGVLIRAVEPLEGETAMLANRKGRGGQSGIELTNGPAKLCQAFGIEKSYNGHSITEPPLTLTLQEPLAADDIVTTTRIGISQAKDTPWRWYIRGNPYVSKQ